MANRTLPVHNSCPEQGCDICQRDWPCARLARAEHDAATELTDQELYDYWISTSPEFGCADPVGFARAALARWGRPAIEPVPVSERPWEKGGWLDLDGECWWCAPDGPLYWSMANPAMVYGGWVLPAHAIPLPQHNEARP